MKAALTALCTGFTAPLLAQGWVPPQPPCEISAAHFKVNGGVLHLKTAAEKPDQRNGQLAEAHRVLVEAILQDKQEKNPGAWYYLGRYYFEIGDAAGADSALARALALAPPCRQDIDGYRRRLWANTLNAGLAAWQGGKEDSAVALFGLAARLAPGNPKAFVALAGLYAGKDNYDSALVYYRRTVEAAGNDTAFAKDKRDARSNGRGDIARHAVRGERPRRCGIRGVRLRRRPRPELRSGRPVHSGSAPHEPAVVSGWRSGPGARPHEESLPPRRALLARGRLLPAA